MQTLAVVGNQPPELVTRGDVRALVAYVVSGFSRTVMGFPCLTIPEMTAETATMGAIETRAT